MPNTPRPKPVRQMLDRSPSLRQLAKAVNQRERLLADIQRRLPADLAPHCRYALHHDDTLVLYVDSPAWATRLRYQAPQLLQATLGDYHNVARVSVQMLLPGSQRHPVKPQRRISTTAAQTVAEAATDTADPALRSALMRLGKRLHGR